MAKFFQGKKGLLEEKKGGGGDLTLHLESLLGSEKGRKRRGKRPLFTEKKKREAFSMRIVGDADRSSNEEKKKRRGGGSLFTYS